jgi:L-amino acid N-acyltransferase YncA
MQTLEQVKLTPVIIISSSHTARIKKAITAKGITVECMTTMTPPEVESCLAIFTKKQKDHYAVFLINPDQGRGLDFPTCSDIEANGGNHVLIAELPSYFL